MFPSGPSKKSSFWLVGTAHRLPNSGAKSKPEAQVRSGASSGFLGRQSGHEFNDEVAVFILQHAHIATATGAT
jgi:hypothetical protein